MDKIEILEAREQKVVKHNELVQKSRFSLSLVEQKTINFIISLVKPKEEYPDRKQPLEYEFKIQTYCKICGIDYKAGKNYKMVRETLRELCRKDAIMMLPDGTETRVTWVNKFWSNKGKGWAKIRFDEDMAPYIFDLYDNTTRFVLLNILPMKSKYSVRIYELCRSWAGIKRKTYKIDELRKLLMIEDGELTNFKDFRRRVLEKAMEEINNNTDLNINFEPIKKGRKVVQVCLSIKEKSSIEKSMIEWKINEALDLEQK